MLAFDFSEKSIEVLEFKKPLFGRLTIIALGKAELEETILKNGGVKDENLLSGKILELIADHRYSSDEECLFNLPKEAYFSKRLKLASDLNKELLKEEIENALVEQTGNTIRSQIYTFLRIYEEDLTQEILVLAVSKEILDSYARVFLQIGLVPIFATGENISVFQGLKEALAGKGLTAVLASVNEELSLSFFDSFGAVSDFKGKLGPKTIFKDFTNARLQVEEETVQQVGKLILAGENISLDPLVLEKKLELPIALASEFIAVQIKERAADLSQIKLPTTLFAKTLGLMLAFEKDPKSFNLITKNLPAVKVERSKIKDQRSKIKIKSQQSKDEEGRERGENEKYQTDIDEEETNNDTSMNYSGVISLTKKLLVVGMILLILFLGYKGIKNLLSNKATQFIDFNLPSESPTDVPSTPTPSLIPPTPTPTLTPTPTPQRSDLKVSVLNGSGVRGAANELSLFLKNLGYNVVRVGNAVRYDYSQTQVSLKESKKVYLEQLKADLATKYSIDSGIETVEEKESFDAQIIIGRK